jgi:HK97 family phage major capsid protein
MDVPSTIGAGLNHFLGDRRDPRALGPDELVDEMRHRYIGDAELATASMETLSSLLQRHAEAASAAGEKKRAIKVRLSGQEPTAGVRDDLGRWDTEQAQHAGLAHRYRAALDRRQALVQQELDSAPGCTPFEVESGQMSRREHAEMIGQGTYTDANGTLVYTSTDRAVGTGRHTGGGHTYRENDTGTSWVRDLVAAGLRGDHQAADRLRRNNRECDTEHRALSTTAGAGGEFVPPLWLMNQWLKLARAGRVVADQVTSMQMPPGTDSINLPRMVTGTAVAEQATQNTAIQNTDATVDSIVADVATIAGMQVVSLQLVEQSPLNIDMIVLQDLLADLAVKTDTFVISNNATNKRGILAVTGVNTVTYTDTTPTASELYPKIADGIQQIHTGRYLPPTKVFMHPRRWAWLTAQVDTTGRPLVVPVAQMPQNSSAAMGVVVAEGFVGSMQGLPVFVDPNLPINLGAGTNEDRIVIARAEDIILMESAPTAHLLRERYMDQLSVGIVLHNYVALHASRYPESIAVISGTGLTTPTF